MHSPAANAPAHSAPRGTAVGAGTTTLIRWIDMLLSLSDRRAKRQPVIQD
jgi:hypothetical protein